MEGHLAGVTIGRPMDLVALRSTFTSSLVLKNVIVDDRWLLRGPAEKVLDIRRKNLNLGQAYLATGLCLAGLDLLAEHRSEAAREAHAAVGRPVAAAEAGNPVAQPDRPRDRSRRRSSAIRGACNDLALRITHTAVAIYKGTALLADHPAQRLAREAMFLLVWSCPNPVIDCTVDLLTSA